MTAEGLPPGRVREVRLYGDPILRTKARLVTEIDKGLLQSAADLVATMLAHDGLGLAANQIGLTSAIVAIDLSRAEPSNGPIVLFNPQVVRNRGTEEAEEGCLSLPGITEVVARHSQVSVQATDYRGKKIEVSAQGIIARALLHEIDHLNGILFIDHLSELRRQMLRSRLARIKESVRPASCVQMGDQ
ncbi:MAG: peptide deformylase [candidate division WOR-3 bacterium]